MRQVPPLLPLLAALALSPALALADGTVVGEGPPVAVYRGTAANVLPTVRVLRGSSAAGAPEAPEAEPAEVEAVGGDRLWLVDPETGELTACRLGGSTRVGRDRVRCTRARLR